MPPQAAMFAERLRNDSRIDMENDWKMVSLFVGGNDLCASCRREVRSSANSTVDSVIPMLK